MRHQLGFRILLVLFLGLFIQSSIHAYYLDDEAQLVNPGSSDILATGDANNELPKVAAEGADELGQHSKRAFGLPGTTRTEPTVSQNSSTEQQQQNNDSQQKNSEELTSEASSAISPPINPPLGTPGSIGSNRESDEPSQTSASGQASQARGFGSDLMSAIGGNVQQQPSGQDNQYKQDEDKQAQPQQQDSQVSQEDLPTIIEKNKPVDPSKQQDLAQEVKPSDPQKLGNSSLLGSTARTFDSWTNCVGSTSNKYGTCKNDIECNKHKGKADGSCMGGLGVCCVMALSCGDKSIENNTFFANPDFPEPSWEARQCHVELTKKHKLVSQIMIEFDEFELAPPNHDGECITDVFHIRLASNKPSPYSGLRICGMNTGQHLYIDVSQVEEPIVLSVVTSGGGFPRRWSIRIVQMDEKNHLVAPPGCLQYYTDTVGHFRSFNLGKNLKNLYYAICFRIDNGYSGVRFSSNYFGMNGAFCRKKIGGSKGHNMTIVAHPHHLVIPPPGSTYPPPKPNYPVGPPPTTYQPPGYSQHSRYRRAAEQNPPSQARTFFSSTEKEAKFEEKEFDKEEHHHLKHHPHFLHEQPGPYVLPHPPPPPPQVIYGNAYAPEPGKAGLGGERPVIYEKEHRKLGGEPFGWKGKTELKYDEKGYYAPPPNYGPHSPPPPLPYGHHSPHPPHYGHPPGPGYHHKEIGKFGEKYEHLEFKHEKNHLGKDEKSSSWWGSFWKKDEKKDKEKFFMHHEALFPLIRMPELPHCEPRYCGSNDVITFPPSGDSIAEMCGNLFNRGRGPKIVSGSPLVVYVSNRGHHRGSGFDMNYEQVFYIPKPY